jgi:hypothetical protein
VKTPKLSVKELTSLAAYYTTSHSQDKTMPFLERTLDVSVRFLDALGYEFISPDLRTAEARTLDSGLHKEYLQALRRVVIAPPNATLEEAILLVIMASPEDRTKALTSVYAKASKP